MTEEQEFQKHHQPKPCNFCGKAAEYTPNEEYARHGFIAYFCLPCRAQYIHYQSGTLGSINLYTTINNKVYRWTESADGEAANLWATEPMDIIMGFSLSLGDVFPSLTPQTVNNKIRTWLMFL